MILIFSLGYTRRAGIGHRSASARRVVESQTGRSSRPVDLTLHVAFHHRTQLVSVRTALDAARVFQRTSRSQHLVLRGRWRAAATLRARFDRLCVFRHVYECIGRVFARGSRRQRVVVCAARLVPSARLRRGTDGRHCHEHDPRCHRQRYQCSWQRVWIRVRRRVRWMSLGWFSRAIAQRCCMFTTLFWQRTAVTWTNNCFQYICLGKKCFLF